jgi:aromatic-L-amino-acid decarboxylase
LLKSLIEADDDFEVAAPVPFSLVCFRHRSDNEFNQRLLVEINSTGKAFLSHTVLNGQFVLRFAIGNFQTNESDVREVWQLIQHTGKELETASNAA